MEKRECKLIIKKPCKLLIIVSCTFFKELYIQGQIKTNKKTKSINNKQIHTISGQSDRQIIFEWKHTACVGGGGGEVETGNDEMIEEYKLNVDN